MTFKHVNWPTNSHTKVPRRSYTAGVSPAPNKGRTRSLGSTAVEFAFIIPLAVFLMLGSIEAGRMVTCKQMLANATMEGARMSAAMGTGIDPTVVRTAIKAAAPMLALADSNIDIEAQVACIGAWSSATFALRAVNDCVRVTVRYTFSPTLLGQWRWMPTSKLWTDIQTRTVE